MKVKIFIVFIIFIFSPITLFSEDGGMKVHFIDVGEGDSILVEAPNGENALIDAGSLIGGFKAAEYLKKQGINSIEHLVFTHPHLDHIGGAFFVLRMFEVKNIYDNGQRPADSDIYRWYDKLVKEKGRYSVLRAGDSFSLGEVSFDVIWPFVPPVGDFNVNSLVIMVKYKGFRCLLAGDLTAAGEKRLLEAGKDLKADVLKVGHHGASDASSEEFLKAVQPKISVISVDKDNIRGCPRREVLKRLKRLNSEVFRTDRDMDIVVTIEDTGNFKILKPRE